MFGEASGTSVLENEPNWSIDLATGTRCLKTDFQTVLSSDRTDESYDFSRGLSCFLPLEPSFLQLLTYFVLGSMKRFPVR